MAVMASVLALNLSGCKRKGEDPTALRLSGIEKLNQEDYSGAVRDFEAAIQASRGKVGAFEIDVLKYRAEAEYMAEDYSAAAHTYDILIQIDGEDREYYYRNAVLKTLAEDLDGALNDYRAGVLLEKKNEKKKEEPSSFGRPQALGAVGKALAAAGRQAEAETLYNEAVQDGAAGPDVFNAIGLNYLEAGQYEEALSAFEKAIQAGSGQNIRDARFNQAVVYEYQGQYQEALQAFEGYVAEFGPDEAAQKEITFLRTR